MTHTPLTKAERDGLPARIKAAITTVCRGMVAMSIPANPRDVDLVLADCAKALADLDAAEAERDEIKTALGVMGATRERALEVAGSQDALEERIDSMSRERDVALKGWSAAEAARDAAAAQRDRAESELDAERRMRVEAEAALDERDCDVHARIRAGYDTTVADLWRAKVAEVEAERDALKAKLDDPRRVVIHETEVVATKEEIATLKTRLADLSEADEELHTCRALVNATSENLSVDLERMVDDLAEANEKAARSEKDSHSWHDLYEDTKAKLAALANAAEVVAENYEECAGFGELDCLAPLYAAIAAARGGA